MTGTRAHAALPTMTEAATAPTQDWVYALKRGEFEHADAQLNALQRRFEARTLDEAGLEAAFAAFQRFDPELPPALSDWVRQHRRSYAASLARGLQLGAQGAALSAQVARLLWGQPQADGLNTAFLSAVNLAATQLMTEHTRVLAEAALELTRSLDLTLKPLLSYVALMPLSPVSPPLHSEALESGPYRRALALHPESLAARRQMLALLHPNLHGAAQFQSMRHYLADEPQVRLEPRARQQLEAELGYAMAFDASPEAAAPHLARAELLEPQPCSQPSGERLALGRARLLFRLGQFARAAAVFEHLLSCAPTDRSLQLSLIICRLRANLGDARALWLLEQGAAGDALWRTLLTAAQRPGRFHRRLKRLLRTLP